MFIKIEQMCGKVRYFYMKMNKKTRRIISTIIVVVLVLAMVVPLVIACL